MQLLRTMFKLTHAFQFSLQLEFVTDLMVGLLDAGIKRYGQLLSAHPLLTGRYSPKSARCSIHCQINCLLVQQRRHYMPVYVLHGRKHCDIDEPRRHERHAHLTIAGMCHRTSRDYFHHGL